MKRETSRVFPLLLMGAMTVALGATLRAAIGPPRGPIFPAAPPEETPVLPWEPIHRPDAELARVWGLTQEEASSRDKRERFEALADNLEEPPLVRGLASFAAGLLLLESGRPEQAAGRFASPALEATELGPHAQFIVGRELQTRNPTAARRALEQLVRQEPSFLHAAEARLRLARLLLDARLPEEALPHLEAAATSGEEDTRGEGLLELATVRIQLGRGAQAVEPLEKLYYDMPTHPLSDEAGKKLSALGSTSGPAGASEDERYRRSLKRARRLEELEDYRGAYNAYTDIQKDHPGLADRDWLELRRGVSLYHRRQTSAAENLLRKVDREDLKPEALYYEALSARRLRKLSTYVSRLESLLEAAPRSPWAEEALYSLARHYQARDETHAALAHYQRVVNEFPRGKHFLAAQWPVLWKMFRDGNYAEAAAGFERSTREHPGAEELPQFLYWAARAHEKTGNPQRAERLYRQVLLGYRNSYYGRQAGEQLAALGVGEDIGRLVDDGRDGIDLREALRVARRDLLRRIAQLLAVGLTDEAELEAKRAVQGNGDDSAFLAVLAWLQSRRDRNLDAFATIRRAFPFHVSATGDLLPRPIWEILYPLKYRDLIVHYSREKAIDPFLVAGLIRQESTWNPRIRSPAGARGLMQIMPATGRVIARQLNRSYRLRDLSNPEVSILYGTHYFREVLDRFGGRIDYALASYNAGPHRVRRWTGMDLNIESDVFIEEIPFQETRLYVKLVLRNEMLYRRLYGNELAVAAE